MRRIAKMVGVLAVPPMISAATVPSTTACSGVTGGCCKVCTKGKACGDICIARNKTCQVVAGCACNG